MGQKFLEILTSSHKTYFKKNIKSDTSNYHILLFLINVKIFFTYNMGQKQTQKIKT
jgi:hypothetical protein